jgi:uncharacterized protein (DUF4415 family)
MYSFVRTIEAGDAEPLSVKSCSSSLRGGNMKTKKSAASSRPGKLIRKSEADIRKYAKSTAATTASKRLRARGTEPDAADLKEMPTLTPGELNGFYRPVKKPVTVRLDADVLLWLRAKGGRYQAHMNAVLRSAMLADTNR